MAVTLTMALAETGLVQVEFMEDQLFLIMVLHTL